MFDLPGSSETILHVDKDFAENTVNKNLMQRLKTAS
jgi:ATP-dependent Clp protease ATP-binding subunit ClpX